MKNLLNLYLLSLAIFLSVLSVNAQSSINTSSSIEPEEELKHHELRLNALYLLLGAIEVNYEYLLSENHGVGLSGMYTYDQDFWEFKHHLTGFYRHYFGKKYAGGFYGEAFVMYNSIEDNYYYFNNTTYQDDSTHNLGLGFAFGVKLISKENLLLDIGAGLGRNIISSGDDNWLVPRFNISFGYRF